ncbi:FMN-binding protein [Spirillospora sp. NPDC029432]|uniref:FMN-binding protein n=1 Tax=Spirillospora sp. NPDC029432 TaxID=3154599 RepID=UPI0034554F90
MRRATAAVAGTLAGTALLLGAKFGADAAFEADNAGANQAAGESGDLEAEPSPSRTASKSPQARNTRRSAAGNGLNDGVYRGATSVNRHGPIQVTIRVANGRITGVAAKHGTTPAKTLQVNRRAIPVLRQQTLRAQGARVDTVSGATYTSGSFATSLRSALEAARA